MLAYGWWLYAIFGLLVGLILWAGSWLNANDRLKKELYPSILMEHLSSYNADADSKMKQKPLIARFYPHWDCIEFLSREGEVSRYQVEFIREDLSLYVVKIHTSPITGEEPGKAE